MTLIALALAGWFVIIPVGIDLPRGLKVAALSPDFWPRIVMIVLALSGASIAVQGWLANRAQARSGAPASKIAAQGEVHEYPPPLMFARVGLALVCLFAFYFAIPYVGVVAGSAVIIAVFAVLLGQRRWVSLGLLAILLPAGLYLFFAHVAHIPMPLGVFETLR